MTMFQELYGRGMEEKLKLFLDDLDVKNVIPFIEKFQILYFRINNILRKL